METPLSNRKWTEHAESFVTSFVTAGFGMWLIYFLTGLTLLYFSYDLDVYARFTAKGIRFFTSEASSTWTRDAVVTIYLSRPVFAFFAGLVFMFLTAIMRKSSLTLFYSFFWLSFFGFSNAFGIFIEEGIAKSGFYEVSKALDLGIEILVAAVSVSVYFLYLTGIVLGKLLLTNIGENRKKNGRLRPEWFLTVLFFPWLLNLLFFIVLMGVHPVSQLIIHLLSMVIILPVLWVNPPASVAVNPRPPAHLNVLDMVTLVLLVIFVYLIYISLQHGVELPLHI